MTASNTHERVLVIRPTTALSWQDFRDAWDYRELLWILALRDVRVRYKQASLGVAWALLQPLTQMLVFTVLFNKLAGIKADAAVPYSVFCFAGLTVWGLFANGLSHSSESLIGSANLVTKVYFPRVLIPLAAIVTAVVDAGITSVLLVALMIWKHVPFHASIVFAIPIAAVAALCAAALGLWMSALNLRYRDVRYALPFFIQMLVYATPVFYSASLLPERYRVWLTLNPMAAVVDGFRAALFGTPIPFARLGVAAAIALVVGALGFVRFRQLEQTFADRI
ncbi:MAG TPA: ABC transporter permease [Polyangia bacterium]|nr:ABC transporter permease [Polyangia bacterium]